MDTQFLGSTGLEVSCLAYGCMRISGTWNPAELTPSHVERGIDSLKAAYDAGYTFFDHADIYGQGTCEEIHGKLLGDSPELRRQTIIATKCGIRFGGDPRPESPHRFDFSRDYIISQCEKSLQRLQVETIDLYQLHRPDYLMDPDEVSEAFLALQASGKVRWFGVSNFPPPRLSLLASALPIELQVNQVEIHLGRLACFEDGTLDQCMAESITPLSWSPLAGGWLGEGGEAPAGKEALTAEMDRLAERHHVSRTEIALAWLLEHPAGIIPIVGTVRPERIAQAVKSLDVNLGREDWYRLFVLAQGHPLP